MSFNGLTGPIIHVGMSSTLAFIFRLNMVVTVFCGILPDLIDKPLVIMGIGGGRYLGHTLLFAVLVVATFSLWKRKYGLAALIGLTSHFLLDLNALIPWFYPFKDYQFYATKLSIVDWIKGYLTCSQAGFEFIIVALAALIAFICLRIYRRYIRRKKS